MIYIRLFIVILMVILLIPQTILALKGQTTSCLLTGLIIQVLNLINVVLRYVEC